MGIHPVVMNSARTAGANAKTYIPCYDDALMELMPKVSAHDCVFLVDAWLQARYKNPAEKLSEDNRENWRKWHRSKFNEVVK